MGWVVALVLAQSFADFEAVTADPDAPVAEAGWQSSLRAKAGLRVPFFELGSGPWGYLRLPSFIELHNAPGNTSVVPYQYLRARIQLEGGAVFQLGRAFALVTALRLEHESDHPVAADTWHDDNEYGFVAMNSFAALGTLRWQRDADAVTLGLAARVHVVTCTRDPDRCGEGHGWRGEATYEGTASLAWQHLLLTRANWGLDVFAAVFGAYTAPTALVVEERRFTAKGGVGLSRAKLGWLYLYVSAWVGNEMGYRRYRQDITQGGFGFGWSY
ncbi:MAG: hypothetical protein IPJ65_01790 [Archangiaceae bacterium]|nr:hypothetical protein [Archangiaceae bacterium]